MHASLGLVQTPCAVASVYNEKAQTVYQCSFTTTYSMPSGASVNVQVSRASLYNNAPQANTKTSEISSPKLSDARVTVQLCDGTNSLSPHALQDFGIILLGLPGFKENISILHLDIRSCRIQGFSIPSRYTFTLVPNGMKPKFVSSLNLQYTYSII